MSASSKRAGGGSRHDAELILLWATISVVALTVGLVNAAVRIAAIGVDRAPGLPGNPFTLLLGLVDGSVTWTARASIVVAAITAVLAVIAAVVGVIVSRRRARGSRVDRAGRRMGKGRDLEALSQRGAQATAKRLGVTGTGLPLGRTIIGDRALFSSWEDVCVDISGPRTGKTTSSAIPMTLAAPGAVIATSNKRDIVDATRGPRSNHGPVWVFDPQGLVEEPATWWWNPLSFVTDEVKATMLADVFTSAGRDPGAKTDAYFEPAGTQLLANLLLAAALGQRPITQVYLWLADPTEDEPVAILKEHGYDVLAAALQGVINYPDKQRGGIYGTAQQTASFLTNRQAVAWVTPPANEARVTQFDAHAFVEGTGTLYSLSKEGVGSAGPLVTALTVAVLEAAEDRAKRSPGGRLAVPLVAVLDEAANTVKNRHLPAQFSHFGSRGICVMTILQSWSQGVEVWGRDGMRKLWSAANVKIYGGGVAEVEFLSELSQLIGDYDLDTTSVSHGKGGRSTSHATRRERVMDVSELAALPKGRAIVFGSGAPATLVRRVPWMAGPHAAEIRASIREHDPAAEETIDQAAEGLIEAEREKAVS